MIPAYRLISSRSGILNFLSDHFYDPLKTLHLFFYSASASSSCERRTTANMNGSLSLPH